MALFLFVVPAGHHEAAWRLPESPVERMYDVTHYAEVASSAEKAGLDAVFVADAPALRTRVRHNSGGSVLEPFTLLSALAATTKSIGLIGTASTTYAEPYNVARSFSSLDHISRGRAGWNIVTTSFADAALNFGTRPHPDRDARYARADEFVEVVKRLWTSWQSDAVVCDRESGTYALPEAIHEVDYHGEHFDVTGPFQAARSPQVHPLLVQAGASAAGRRFAARHADVVFSVHRSRGAAAAFRTSLRDLSTQLRRVSPPPLLLPGVSVHVAETDELARAKKARLDDLVIASHGIRQIRAVTGLDLSAYGMDERLDPTKIRSVHGATQMSRADEILAIIDEADCTLRELVTHIAGARAHRVLVGTADSVADSLEEWFVSGACDGFNLLPPSLPGGLDDIVHHLLPELRRRNVWWPAESGTLRQRLGLDMPG